MALCYAPLNPNQQETFLDRLLEESKKFRIKQGFSTMEIPHQTISIQASKMKGQLG